MKRISLLLSMMLLATTLLMNLQVSQNRTSESTAVYASTSDVYVFVNESLYKSIEASLVQYGDDLLFEGYTVILVNVTQSTSAYSIRQTLASDPNVVGCLLVGHTPAVWCSLIDPASNQTCMFITDFYFMDLDGTWTDTNSDGYIDSHTGNVEPEIWCSRIKAWGANETNMINTYFAKVHKLRTGQLAFPPQRSLIYVDDDWGGLGAQYFLNIYSSYYDNTTVVVDKQTTTAADYKNRLKDGYEMVALFCHGSPGEHGFFNPDPSNPNNRIDAGTVNCSDYFSMDPKSFIMNFYTCVSALHTFPNGVDIEYLAGAWIFMPTYGLIAVGGSGSGMLANPPDFCNPFFREGKSVGEAFKDWAIIWGEQIYLGCKQYWGVALCGDPTLKKPNVAVHAQDQNGNLLARGDVYVDGALYGCTNTTMRIWSTNRTIFVNDYWENTSTAYTTDRYTFSCWEDSSTSSSRNISILNNMAVTVNFTRKYCPCDVDGNGKVDMKDVAMVARLFGENRGSAKWDSRTDVVCDNTINMKDTGYVAKNFNKQYP